MHLVSPITVTHDSTHDTGGDGWKTAQHAEAEERNRDSREQSREGEVRWGAAQIRLRCLNVGQHARYPSVAIHCDWGGVMPWLMEWQFQRTSTHNCP